MGMTDKQFNSWVRFLYNDINDLERMTEESDNINIDEIKKKIKEIKEALDETMKD